jgi:hypothetical protein
MDLNNFVPPVPAKENQLSSAGSDPPCARADRLRNKITGIIHPGGSIYLWLPMHVAYSDSPG